MKPKGFVLLPVIVIIVILGILIYSFFKNYQQQVNNSIPFLPKAGPTSNPTSGWKIYTSTGKYKYQVDIPNNQNPIVGIDFIRFSVIGLDYIQISCPRGAGIYLTTLPNPKDWKPNEGGWETKYYKQLIINNMKAVQYIWSADPNGGELLTSLLRNNNPVVCEIWTYIHYDNENYKKIIESQINYNKVVNSFKFIE